MRFLRARFSSIPFHSTSFQTRGKLVTHQRSRLSRGRRRRRLRELYVGRALAVNTRANLYITNIAVRPLVASRRTSGPRSEPAACG
jgi:hypothetical protein